MWTASGLRSRHRAGARPLQASSGSGDRHDDPLSPVHARSTSGDANAAEADRVSAAVGSAHTTTTLDRRCALEWGWSLFCTFVPHLVPRSFPSVVGNENTPDTRGYSFIPHVPHQMGISGLRARSRHDVLAVRSGLWSRVLHGELHGVVFLGCP